MKKNLIKKDRQELIRKASSDTFDVIIVGGGATGLGAALDASLRGLKVLLLEMEDFGSGTSSKSTKLIHGGVRYLEQGNIGLVREALIERKILLKNASDLVKSRRILIPVKNLWQRIYFGIGLKLYDFLSGASKIGKSHFLNKEKTIQEIPQLNADKIYGSIVYYDGQFDDSRFLITLLRACFEHGGLALNYAKVDSFLKDEDDKIQGVKWIDQESLKSFESKSKYVINATGAFAEKLLWEDNKKLELEIAPSQGTHIVLDRSFIKDSGFLVPKTKDGRVLFALPWNGVTLVGTTDVPIEKVSNQPKATKEEISFLIETWNSYFKKQISSNDVNSVFTGIRPLISAGEGKSTKSISRSHRIEISDSHLITISGGKWTTYRSMAEELIDKLLKHSKTPFVPSKTSELILNDYMQNVPVDIWSDDESLRQFVRHACQYDLARTADDILSRRTRLSFYNRQKSYEKLDIVLQIMSKELSKDETWILEQKESFKNPKTTFSIEELGIH